MVDKKTIERLVKAHQYLYYCKGTPVLSDYAYDHMCDKWGIFGGGGSDMESSYSEDIKKLAMTILEKSNESI